MAFSFSSPSPSPSWSFFQNQRIVDRDETITQEEFFAFHNIDRKLFARLVFNMSIEPKEAMHVSAFWLWLEQLEKAQYVATIVTLPDNIFKTILGETLLCLRVIECDNFVHSNNLPMMQTIMGKDNINLRFFHENRVSIFLRIGNFVKEICLRAFKDLFQLAMENRHQSTITSIPLVSSIKINHHDVGIIGGGRSRGIGSLRPATQPPLPAIYEEMVTEVLEDNREVLINYPNLRVGDFSVPLRNDHFDVFSHNTFLEGGASSSNYVPMLPTNSVINNTNYTLETQPQVRQGDLVDQMLTRLQLNEISRLQMIGEMPNVLPISERTIFLTFSKGYPIYENELHEFFNR